MNIDFHYGIIYIVSRLAELSPNDAEIVAHSCQYVDDATTNGILDFEGGETYERFASAHEMFDYDNLRNGQNRVFWAPFHFLPAGIGQSLDEKAVCRPDSKVARAMIKRAIEERSAINALHRLGVSLHVYVDTWAHQGFSGVASDLNYVQSLSGDDHDNTRWLDKLEKFLSDFGHDVQSGILDKVSKLGHGAALHFPDMPWAKWQYTNGKGELIQRDNLPDFVEAANMACKAVRGYINSNPNFENEAGLSEAERGAIENLLASNRSHDGDERLKYICDALQSGEIPKLKEQIPRYIGKGHGSWKHIATGIEEQGDGDKQPKWSANFEESDYRKFHDAVKRHRFVVTQEILPTHGVRLA